MKLRKVLFASGFIVSVPLMLPAQTIFGSWQLVKESSCLEETASAQDDGLQGLREEMHSQSAEAPQVISFRDNSTAEESTRILNSRRSANQKKFLYKFNGEMLLILDKKSQTISDSYLVDKLTADSLILSNASRPCETKILLRINRHDSN